MNKRRGYIQVKSDMRRYHRYYTVIILTLFGFVLIGAAKEKKEPVQFDFKKTSHYFHDSFDKRPDFPVSIVQMNDYVYSLRALGETIDAKLKKRMITFSKKLQQTDGGFTIDTANSTSSSLYTYYALETLAYLDSLGSIDIGKAKSYLSSLKQPDGGFCFDKRKKESAFATTYYAVHALSLIESLPVIDKARTAEYIKRFEKKDTGGFSYVKGTGISTSKDTYMAVYALKTLGMLDDETKKRTIKFLTSTPYIGNFKKTSVTLTLEEEAYTLSTLRILEGVSIVNKEKVVLFLKTFYVPDDGGFAAIEGFNSAPDPTCMAMRSLAELGLLKRPVENPIK
jgi:prenyltransferase beta subunit